MHSAQPSGVQPLQDAAPFYGVAHGLGRETVPASLDRRNRRGDDFADSAGGSHERELATMESLLSPAGEIPKAISRNAPTRSAVAALMTGR